MKGRIMYQRLHGLVLMLSFIFLSVVYENFAIQEKSTSASQQIDLTTPSQVTGLKPQKTVYISTIMSKSMSVFATDYISISYSSTTSPSLGTMTAPKILKTSTAETAAFTIDILSTSVAIYLPTKKTSISAINNSKKITKSLSSESTVTTRVAGAIVTETFHSTPPTDLLHTSRFTNNSIVSKTSAIGSQLAIMKTTSLYSSIESTSVSATPWYKQKPKGNGTLSVTTASQEFLASAVAGTVPWSIVKQTSTHIWTASAFPPESVLISIAASVDNVFPRNKTASTLAMTDTKIFTVHSTMLPTRPIEMTPELRTPETELTPTNFQDVSSPRVEDKISISISKEASYMSRSFRTSSSFTRAQSTQRVIDAKTTDTVLPPGVTLAPTAVKSMLPPIVTGPVYTQNIPRGDETTFSLISTISASTSKPSESGLTSISGEVAHLFTSDITWTPRPDQTILTSIFHGSASNTEHSLITIDIITLPETSTESEATNIADAIIATDAIIDRSTAVLSNLTSPWLANFSIVPGTTPVAKPPEFNLTTLCIRTTPMFTIARNEFLLTPRKTVVPQVGTISTLVDIESNFSTEEGTSDTTKVETKSTIAFGETIVPIPEPATTQRFSASVTRNETTSHYLKGRLTIAATVVSPVATMREATDESLQMVTASSITVSPLSDLETLTTTMDNKTATTGVKGSWLSPKSVKTTPKTSYNGTTEIFNSTHTYTAHWTSETLLEGNTTPSPTSGSIQTFPGTLVSSTTKILETSFATIPTDRTARSLSTGILPSQPIATHSSSIPVPITHIFSLPVNVFPVTSIVISEETKVTKSESSALIRASSTSVLSGISALSSASVPPWDQTASITSNIMPTQVNPTHTTSETTMISVRMASMAISFLKEAPVSLLRPTTPVVNKVETTLLSPSADTVTSSTPTLACSKSLPDNISVLSSTHMTSTMSTSVATQPISQVEETSTHALSFPYAFSDSENVVSLVTGTTKASVIDETIPSNTSADKLTNSDHHISLFSTCLANTLVSTLSVTDISTFSSDKEQMTTSLRNSSGTMELEGISPSKNDFISESQSTSSLEMTDTGFAETTKVSSHQTRSPSETPLVTPYHGTSTSSPISGSIETILTTWTSSNKDVHISGMSASLGKTALTSQVLTITTFLSPGKEKMGNLSVYTPGTEQMTVTTASVTHQDTLFADNITSKTISISNPVSINTTLSHLFSPRTQPEVTSVASPISENTQTSPESLSSSTAGLSSGSSTVIYTGGIAIPLSAPSVTTAFLGKTSMVTSIPIYRMSLLSVSVTAFTSKRVSDTSTILMTKYSKTKYLDCLKSPSIVTSGPVFEMSSMSVYDSAFLPPVVSSDTSTRVGSFSTSLSSITLRNTKTIHTTTLNATPVIYTGSPSKIPAFSSTFTTSEIKYITSKITPISFPSPTELTYSSMKTIPTTIMAKMVTPFVGSNASFLLSSKNTKTISSIPKTAFSPFLSMTLQSSQGNEATTLDILTGITNSSQSTVSSDSVAVITNTYSRAAAPKGVISPTPSEDLRTSLNIQVSPFLISSKSTPGSTKSIKATSFLPLNTKIVMFLSENTSTAELTKDATSMSTSVSYHARALSSATLPSFISLFFSPHSTKAEFFTTKTCRLPTSHMVEFPVLGTRTPPSNRQSRLMTSWHTLKAEDSQVPIFTTTHVPTPNKMETETTYFVRGSLSTFTASKTNLLSGDVMAISTSGILPTWGIAESLSLSISSRSIPTTLVDIKQTFEKNTTSVTPGTTLPSNSGVASGNIISKTTISPMLIWILSNLPLNPPLEFVSNTPHIIASSTVEVAKSTFLISDMTPTQPITKLTTISFATMSPILTKTTLTTTVGSITTGFPTSLPMLIKITDDIVYISKSPETSRTTVTANSRAVSQISSFSEMSNLSLTTDHTLSIGSIFLPKLTITSTWSRIPAASASPTFVFPKPTLDSFPNITTVTSTATEASFPLISTGVTHPSTAIVSSLLPSSFETTWMDSKPSFLSTETLTSPIAIGSTVSFYNIGMSFSVFDENPVIPISSVLSELAENWLNSIFQNSEFSLVNLAIQIKSRDTSKEEITMERSFIEGQEMATISHILYSCVCQVIIKTNSSQVPSKLISRIKSKIHGNLTHGNFTQNRLTLLVKSKHVAVKKLDPGKCKADQTTSKYKGTYKWLLTNPTETAQTRCIKNEAENATRICSISIYTGKAQWEKPKFKQCKLLQGLPDKIVDLANITISDENADDVAEHILNLINESPSMDEEETKIIVSKLSDISQCDEISMNLTQIILQIINTALRKQNNSLSDLHEVSNEILRIIKRVGHKMEFFGRTANLTVSRLALAVLRVDQTFDGVGFSIRSYEEGTDPEIYLSEVPLGRVLASIYLPKSLRKKIPLNNLQTILFNFFGLTSLFKTKNVAEALTTYVVSASISDTSIQNLADPVVITLQHIEGNQNYDQVHCAFWDFGTNNGQGGWNSSGCKVKETNINYTICHCDHLTHFGVLLVICDHQVNKLLDYVIPKDFSRSAVDAVNERILVLITYTGCGISSIFLGVVMVTYIAFHKLRKDYPSKILINLCTALLMLNLVFLVNSWSSSFQTEELCITAAVALHYFLLVSLTWMGLEAVHMYFALVKVFNIYIPNYILKFCVIGWGIPAIMVAIILSVKKDLYGTLSSTSSFCWIKDDSLFYISVVAYFCLIFLMNFSIFHTVLAQLNSIQLQNPKTWQKMILHDLKGTISLTFLLGLTWGFAFFAWGPVRILFLYLFAIFNTLQGFLIFVFHCAMKESVREQWQIHLCCGWPQLENSSDRNSRYELNVGHKQERLKKTFEHKLLTPSLKSTATTSTFNSLGSAQGIPSEISFPNDDFDEDPYCLSHLSCDIVPNCVRRILPAEIKINSIHKKRFLQ